MENGMNDCAMARIELEIIAVYNFLELMQMTDVALLLNTQEFDYLQEMVLHIIVENH